MSFTDKMGLNTVYRYLFPNKDPFKPIEMTVAELKENIRNGEILPGVDFVVRHGESSWLNGAIAHVQKGAINDLIKEGKAFKPEYGCISEELVNLYCQFSHAGKVMSDRVFVHDFRPGVQTWEWERYIGKELMFLKVRGATPKGLMKSLLYAEVDLRCKEPYDTLDLIAFLIRWHTKVLWRIQFYKIFGSSKHDICSTRVLYWNNKAGIMNIADKDKWGFYPARFPIEQGNLWELVHYIKLVK
jgi:hypothetical protein